MYPAFVPSHHTCSPLNVFCCGPGTQAKCTMHPQMPSAAPHPSTIPPRSGTLYFTLPSISNKHLQALFMMGPLPRCIRALLLLLGNNKQCTLQKNVSFSSAITWKTEVHLSFVVIDIYAKDTECNTLLHDTLNSLHTNVIVCSMLWTSCELPSLTTNALSFKQSILES